MGRRPGHGPAWESRREVIIDLAADLFASKGYAGTGMAELSTVTGLGRGSLYHYIGSKENLLVEIQDRVMRPLLSLARRIAALDESALLRLRLLSECMIDLIATRLDYIWVYEHDYRYLTGTNRARVVGQRHEFEGIIRGLFEAGIEVGAFRPVDPHLAMLEFLNIHNHTFVWAATMMPLDASKLSAEYCHTLFFGMSGREVAARTDLEADVEKFRRRYHGPPLSMSST